MGWKKLKKGIEMWEEPCLGSVDVKAGERFMALCVDPSSKNLYRGIARNVYHRKGSVDAPGFIDHSKLVLVESDDLLRWRAVGDLELKDIEGILEKFQKEGRDFFGLEDPDIIIDEKGLKHIYFTIAYELIGKEGYNIYLGHAFGDSLKNLQATNPVIGPLGENNCGFKEIAFSLEKSEEHYLHLAETGIKEGAREVSCIAVVRASGWGGKWDLEKIALHPLNVKQKWCGGHVSPCRILSKERVDPGKNLRALIINGRALQGLLVTKSTTRTFFRGWRCITRKPERFRGWIVSPCLRIRKQPRLPLLASLCLLMRNMGCFMPIRMILS